jgi:hypothetical protein
MTLTAVERDHDAAATKWLRQFGSERVSLDSPALPSAEEWIEHVAAPLGARSGSRAVWLLELHLTRDTQAADLAWFDSLTETMLVDSAPMVRMAGLATAQYYPAVLERQQFPLTGQSKMGLHVYATDPWVDLDDDRYRSDVQHRAAVRPLLRDSSALVRQQFVLSYGSENLAPQLCQLFVNDAANSVRQAAYDRGLHHNLPGGPDPVVTVLADPSQNLRTWAARRKKLVFGPGHEALFTDPDPQLRAAVVVNPNTTAEQLDVLLRDPDRLVRAAIPKAKCVTADQLVVLAADPDPTVSQTARIAILSKINA